MDNIIDQHLVYFQNAYQRGSDTWTHIPHHKRSLNMLEPFLKKEDTLLDIGTGRGIWLMKIAQRGHRILGIDIIESLVQELNQNIYNKGYEKKARCILGEACAIPFTNQSFDIVTNIGTFQHISREEWDQYFSELTRVLKPQAYYLNVSLSKRTRRYLGFTPHASSKQFFKKFGTHYYFLDDRELPRYLEKDFDLIDEQYESFASPSEPGDDIVLSFSLLQKK